MALGDLIVKLSADVAQFQSDMGRAVHIANQQSAAIARGMEKAKAALTGLVAGFSAVTIAAQFRGLVQGIAELDDLAEKTGAAVEELSKLEQVARIGGHQIITVEQAMVRLNKALSGVTDEESKGAGKALQALGLSADELRRKDPAEALRTIALELNKFADGGGKSALAMDLFGKSGAQALPFLKDLANFQGIATKVTAEQAAQAEALANSFRRLEVESLNAKRALASELVPWISKLIQEMNQGIRVANGFWRAMALTAPGAGFSPDPNKMRDKVEGAELALKRMQDLQRRMGGYEGAVAEAQRELDFARKQREYALALQQIDALSRPGGDSPGERQRFLQRQLPVLDYKPLADAAKAAKADFDYVRKVFEDAGADLQKFAEQQQRALDSLLAETDEAKTQKFLASLTLLDNEFFRGAIGVKQYDQAVALLTGRMDKAVDEMAELKQLLAQTDMGKTEELLRKVNLVDRAFFDGKINEQQYEQLIKLLTETKNANKEAADEITEFWRSAAESMQRSMSDFFFDIMQGNLRNLGDSFKRTIDRMVADNLAAQASVGLFGKDFGKGGQIGGLVGNIISGGIGSLFGGGGGSVAKSVAEEVISKVPAYDAGTPYVPRTQLAVVHEGERILTREQNQRGGMVYAPVFNIPASVDRRSIAQIEAAAFAGAQRSASKNL